MEVYIEPFDTSNSDVKLGMCIRDVHTGSVLRLDMCLGFDIEVNSNNDSVGDDRNRSILEKFNTESNDEGGTVYRRTRECDAGDGIGAGVFDLRTRTLSLMAASTEGETHEKSTGDARTRLVAARGDS